MQNFHHKRQRNSEISKQKKKKKKIINLRIYHVVLVFDTPRDSHFDRVTSILIASENEFTGRGLRIYPRAIQRKKEVLIESVVINV